MTGVSLAYTVRALDAGLVISHEKLEIDEYVMVFIILQNFHFLLNHGTLTLTIIQYKILK